MKIIFDDFEIIKRSGKIILSSPHSHKQFREGLVKARELRTGTLAKEVSSKTNCSCIYRTKFAKNDPNYDKKSTYKEQLVDFIKKNDIKMLIDIHGMKATRKEDICIGTGFYENTFGDESLVKLTKSIFEKNGFKNVTIDEPFNASFPYTVSSYVSRKAKIPCLQIEINNKYTYKKFDTFDFEKLVRCFTEIIDEATCFLA